MYAYTLFTVFRGVSARRHQCERFFTSYVLCSCDDVNAIILVATGQNAIL